MVDDIIIVKQLNQVYLQLQVNTSQALELKDYFSVYVPNYLYHPKYRAHLWSGKVSFFDVRGGLLPIGLLNKFFDFCEQYNYSYKLDFDKTNFFLNIDKDKLEEFYNKILEPVKEKYTLRDYQKESIFKLLSQKKGIVEHATGSGKSLVIYMIIRFLRIFFDAKILLVVPTTNLVEQMYTDFSDYGWKEVGDNCNKLYTQKILDLKKPVLISTWQSLYKKDRAFFEKYDCLIVDEVHKAKCISIRDISTKCINAQFRFGFTGTIQKELADQMTIFGYIGRIVHSVETNTLIDKGILSKISIANLVLKYDKKHIDIVKRCNYDSESQYILQIPERYKAIDFILDNTKDTENTLLLCKRIEHLDRVKEYIKKKYGNKFKIYKIYGEIKTEIREDIRKKMESENGIILCATFATMGTGVNIKNLHQTIFFDSYKSFITIIQSIGRTLRLHPTKDRAIIWDIVDDCTYIKRTGNIGKNYYYQHWEERMGYYKDKKFSCFTKYFKI